MFKHLILLFPLFLSALDLNYTYDVDYKQCDAVIAKETYNICYSYKDKGPLYVFYKSSDFYKDKKVLNKTFKLKEENLLDKKYIIKKEDYYNNKKYLPTKLFPTRMANSSLIAKEDSYYISNTVPMNNETFDIWEKIEEFEEKQIDKYKILFVNTGVIYSNNSFVNKRIKIPKAFYKTIYAPIQKKMIAFYVPHVNKEIDVKNIHLFEKKVSEIEKLTNIKFYENTKLKNKISYF